MTELLSPSELEASLREIGARRYHNLHPFHRMLHGGKCSRGQVQAWALNRYYYQAMIPLKDASLIARCEDPPYPSGMAQAAGRSRWQRGWPAGDRGGRDRTLAQADGGPRAGSRNGDLHAAAAAWYALRG